MFTDSQIDLFMVEVFASFNGKPFVLTKLAILDQWKAGQNCNPLVPELAGVRQIIQNIARMIE